MTERNSLGKWKWYWLKGAPILTRSSPSDGGMHPLYVSEIILNTLVCMVFWRSWRSKTFTRWRKKGEFLPFP